MILDPEIIPLCPYEEPNTKIAANPPNTEVAAIPTLAPLFLKVVRSSRGNLTGQQRIWPSLRLHTAPQ